MNPEQRLIGVLAGVILTVVVGVLFLVVMYWANRIHSEEKWGPKGRKIAAEDTKKAELSKKKVPLYCNKDDYDTPESEPE